MKLGVKIKEKIARTIAEHFTTNEIVNVFTDANITTDKSLYAKWRITLDAFSRTTTEDELFHILEEFCHPLNFSDPETRNIFIEKLNTILSYEFLDIVATEKTTKIINLNDETPIDNIKKLTKTSTDYIVEALNFFKNEYNKVRISGLDYEYSLGENIKSNQLETADEDEYSLKLEAIKQLKNVGFIREYKIEERVEGAGYYIWDYAVCKIDENQITQKEEPKATEAGIRSITEQVIKHEHIHRFENSIQEKGIQIEHHNEKKANEYYITKNISGDYLFENNPVYIKNKDADYVIIFDVAYSLRPLGGKIEYKKIIEQCKKRKLTVDKKGILRALTGKDANFFKYVKDLKQEPKYGISLFVAMQNGKEIEFNNKK